MLGRFLCLSHSLLSAIAVVDKAPVVVAAEVPLNNKAPARPRHARVHNSDPNPLPSLADLERTASPAGVDGVLDRLVGTTGGAVIQGYRPEPAWLWRQFFGTVVCDAWTRVLANMAWALCFCLFARHRTHGDFRAWELEAVDPRRHPFVARLAIYDKIWTTLMGLTTFLLTFFLNQAYAYWRAFLRTGRKIQGHLSTVLMLLTSHAARDPDTGAYTAAAEAFLRDVARRLRLFHVLHWASHSRRLRVLLTDAGLGRLVDRGMLTPRERELLTPVAQRHYAVLQSTIATCQGRIDDAAIMGLRKFDLGKLVLAELCQLRGACADVPDMVDSRMPLAYAHFVQVLVDTFLVLAPIAK